MNQRQLRARIVLDEARVAPPATGWRVPGAPRVKRASQRRAHCLDARSRLG